MYADISQLNVRMPTDLKERGNATLALMGSSPARIIRQLWETLARGGEAYESVIRALEGHQDASSDAVQEEDSPLERATHLFGSIGSSLGLDEGTFVPDERPLETILGEIEWERLEERGLA